MRHHRPWDIIVAWVLATVAGVVVGILSVLTLVTGFALAGASTLLVGLIGGAGLGAGLGMTQWLVLRRHIPAAGWWVLVSSVGGIIGVAVALMLADGLRPLIAASLDEPVRSGSIAPRRIVSSALENGVAGTGVGLGLGSAQWLVLRRSARSAGWWIVASCVGWMASLSLGAGMLDLIGTPLSLLVVGIVVGAATGSMLSCLLSGPAPSEHATAI
jgi:hypothetical protein